MATAGCIGTEAEATPGVEVRVRDSLGLAADAPVVVVLLGGARTEVHLVPDSIEIDAGGAVVFRTTDRRPHAVLFDLIAVAPEVREFLTAGGQESSPPLIDQGDEFVLDLRGAPSGRYPYTDEAGASGARGVLIVR